jgi:diguanylate cyclase (GGDEF)-like protein
MTINRENSQNLDSVDSHARVMMVDDEPILIELVRAFLEDAGYNDFIGIHKPETALERLRSETPDVLLLDLMMPKVSGFDILEQVHIDSDLKHIPTIVMTSASDADTKLRVLEMGATDFLEKPVDPSELVLRLRNTLAFKAHRDRVIYFDSLTGLPNRRLFMSQLASSLRRATKNNSVTGLVKIDVDRLKRVNETLGHRVGDALVKTVSQRLNACLIANNAAGDAEDATTWSLSRVGGAEFVCLMSGLKDIDEAAALGRAVINAMAHPFVIDEHELIVSVSVGVAAGPEDASDPDTLFQHANAALGASKAQGRNSISFFSDELNAAALERLNMETDLRKAIANKEFQVFYQPKVDIQKNRIAGSEALIRWSHPTRGMIKPGLFIPLAEELGLVDDIGTWVLQEACEEAVRWREAGLTDCGVSVNIAASHFYDGRLMTDVENTLSSTGLNPCLLTLEVTESMMMHHSRENLKTLESLKTMGVRTSLDDFGTGFSSLAHLKRMRIDELKIDQSFVAGLPSDNDSGGIVRAVLAMAESLGIDVTAEGVETEAQLDYLRDQGLRIYQGFLCSQPLPADRFVNLLRQEYNGLSVAAVSMESPDVPETSSLSVSIDSVESA